jgi:hypothetical protein
LPSSSTSPGHTSSAWPQLTLPAKMENKSQSTGLVVLATWFQTWAKKKKRKREAVMRLQLSERLHDPRDPIHIQSHLESKAQESLCIDIFRIYFRSPLLELLHYYLRT